jgi:hypothetical protein
MGLSQSDLSVFDVREALYELGRRDPDALVDILLEWGYDGKI